MVHFSCLIVAVVEFSLVTIEGLSTTSSSPQSQLPKDILRALRESSTRDATVEADGIQSTGCILTNLLSAKDRSRDADAPDAIFYDYPFLVQHNDVKFRERLESLYGGLIPPDGVFLDLGSSWVSHLPSEPSPSKVWLHGMNKEELDRNPRGTGLKIVRSFNEMDDPHESLLSGVDCVRSTLCLLPEIPSGSVDVVGICAAFQYWRFPERVAGEILRVLKPGGYCVVSFSNRLFASKAVRAWTRRSDGERLRYVADILEKGASLDEDVGSFQISVEQLITEGSTLAFIASRLGYPQIASDPFLAVVARKMEAQG